MKSLIAKVIVFAIAGLSPGCQYLAKKVVEKPKVELARVDVRDVSATGAVIVFGVKVDNPNSFNLRVDALRYDIEVGGKLLSSGRIDKPAEVEAKASSVIDVPVPVKFTDIFASVLDFLQQGTSSYRVKGNAAFGVFDIPFDEKGELKFKQ